MKLFASGSVRAVTRACGAIFVAATLSSAAAYADDSRLTLHTATGDYDFGVDVVDTPASRAQGLMYVTELDKNSGMLFDFLEERDVSFWMRNTFIPLDMIFVDAEGEVKSIHVNARPHDPTSIPSGFPVQFVLEIPGGRSVEIGLKPGDKMDHDRIDTCGLKPVDDHAVDDSP